MSGAEPTGQGGRGCHVGCRRTRASVNVLLGAQPTGQGWCGCPVGSRQAGAIVDVVLGAEPTGQGRCRCCAGGRQAGASVDVLSSKALEVASGQSLDRGWKDGSGGRSLTASEEGGPGVELWGGEPIVDAGCFTLTPTFCLWVSVRLLPGQPCHLM